MTKMPTKCKLHDPCQLQYEAKSLWTESKLKRGHKQKQCPDCKLWYFWCEWGKPRLTWRKVW